MLILSLFLRMLSYLHFRHHSSFTFDDVTLYFNQKHRNVFILPFTKGPSHTPATHSLLLSKWKVVPEHFRSHLHLGILSLLEGLAPAALTALALQLSFSLVMPPVCTLSFRSSEIVKDVPVLGPWHMLFS